MTDFPFEQIKKDIALTHRIVSESNIGGIDCLFIESRKSPLRISLIYNALGEFFHTSQWDIKEDSTIGRYLDLGEMREDTKRYDEWKRLNSI